MDVDGRAAGEKGKGKAVDTRVNPASDESSRRPRKDELQGNIDFHAIEKEVFEGLKKAGGRHEYKKLRLNIKKVAIIGAGPAGLAAAK